MTQLTIENLPNEVLLIILQHLDAYSIVKAECVCKRWNKLLNLPCFNPIWRKECLKIFPRTSLFDLCGKFDWNHQSVDFHWKVRFAKLHRSINIKSWPYTRKIFPGNYPIHCLDFSVGSIVTGHRTGNIVLWTCKGQPKEIFRHQRMVTDIKFMDKFSTPEKAIIVCTSADFSISVHYLVQSEVKKTSVFNQHGIQLKSVRCFDDKFAVLAADNTISLWNVSLADYKFLKISLIEYIHGPEQFASSLCLWENCSIKVITHSGGIYQYKTSSKEWILSSALKLLPDAEVQFCPFFDSKGFQDSIFMYCSSFDSHLYISVDKKYTRLFYNYFSHLTSVITSYGIHGNLLGLGTENGTILLYHFTDHNDLLKIEIENPEFEINVSEASILSIAINDDGRCPLVAAATSDAIHLIKWTPPFDKWKYSQSQF